MASNSEYQQRQFFNHIMTQEEIATIILQDIIRHKNLKEKFKKAFYNSVLTGEFKIENT